MPATEPRSISRETLTVQSGACTCWRAGPGALDALVEEWPGDGRRAVVVADRRAWRAWGAEVAAVLRRVADAPTVIGVAPGERSKHPAVWIRLVDALIRSGVDRDTVVVAAGGGVTTDLAGFAAATALRGLRLVLVPTTLVGQVDAALGGKTGLDLGGGKNLVGAFHWPVATVCDPRFLATLPPREVRNGVAEMVKCALVGDAALLDDLDRDAPGLAAGRLPDPGTIRRAAAVKWAIVGRDPFEKGERRVLNLGHTAGHAIETASGFKVRHGEAVAAGLAIALRVASRLAGFDAREAEGLCGRLRRLGLPDAPQVPFEAARPFMNRDKKVLDGRVRMALPRAPGLMEPAGGAWVMAVDDALLAECWHGPR